MTPPNLAPTPNTAARAGLVVTAEDMPITGMKTLDTYANKITGKINDTTFVYGLEGLLNQEKAAKIARSYPFMPRSNEV